MDLNLRSVSQLVTVLTGMKHTWSTGERCPVATPMGVTFVCVGIRFIHICFCITIGVLDINS